VFLKLVPWNCHLICIQKHVFWASSINCVLSSRVPQSIVRAFVKNHGINIWTFWNTMKNSKCSWTCHWNFCLSVGAIGVISMPTLCLCVFVFASSLLRLYLV
jgi:hypothetical protein